MVYQEEECGKTGRHHYQGYIELRNGQRMSGMKRLFMDNELHLEGRKGTREEAKKYCMEPVKIEKETGRQVPRVAGPWEHGKWIGGQGDRSDLTAAVDMVMEGKSIKEVAEEHAQAFVQHCNGLPKLAALVQARPKPVTRHVHWIWGASGAGKSTRGKALAAAKAAELGQPSFYTKASGLRDWFYEYKGERVVLLEDVDKEPGIPEGLMLALTDNENIAHVPVKHGGEIWAADYIFITANTSPQRMYPKKLKRDTVYDPLATPKKFWNEPMYRRCRVIDYMPNRYVGAGSWRPKHNRIDANVK